MSRSVHLALLAASVVAAACGGGAAGPLAQSPGEPPPPAAALPSCVGAVPAHATMCPGAGAELTSDLPRVVTGPAGACTTAKCSYVCEAGASFLEGGCVVQGEPPPAERFTDRGDGTVSDAWTGRTWLKDAHCAEAVGGVETSGGALAWWDAATWVAALASGRCGLSDGSRPGDWHLPAATDLLSLVAVVGSPESPFQPQWETAYWAGFPPCIGLPDGVYLDGRTPQPFGEESLLHVWPVR